jgi:hypothetical protein
MAGSQGSFDRRSTAPEAGESIFRIDDGLISRFDIG